MAIPKGSLQTFLQFAKTSLQKAITEHQRITIVSGNQSCDLDSIFSAITFAYIQSSNPLTKSPLLYVPLLNIPRGDIRIRPELLKVLPYANLQPSDLITLDDLQVEGADGTVTLKPETTKILLTDHNSLDGPLADQGFGPCVVGCIDHHVDDGTIPKDTGDEPRIIQVVGSCTSLVTRYCRPAWDALSSSASQATNAASAQDDASVGADDVSTRRLWDAQLARVALSPCLIDTNNLKDQGKTTDVDVEAVKYLEAKVNLAPVSVTSKFDQEAYYKEVKKAKGDLGSLSLSDVLRKDYKQWAVSNNRQLGISSSVKSLAWLIKQAGDVAAFEEEVMAFAQARQLDFCTIMTTYSSDDGHKRELFIWSIYPQGDNFVETFQSEHGNELGLKDWNEVSNLGTGNSNTGRFRAWWQQKIEMSRKQVAPLLRKALGSSDAS